MTRFWLTLDKSVNFVELCFSKMKGGETFVPIIPSIKITDLAKSLSNKIKLKQIGIRPGEKIHEVLCPKESSHLTYKFKNFFIIFPEDKFKKSNKIKINNEIGQKVSKDFEYSSGNNPKFLSIKEIKKINDQFDDSI